MSEFLRHDFALYTASGTAIGTLVPRSTQLDRDGFQAVNCSHWNSIIVQLLGTWTAGVQIQFSMDGSTWVAVNSITVTGGIQSSTITGNGLYTVPVLGKYVRIQTSSYTSGTITAYMAGSAAYSSYTSTNAFTPSTSSSTGAGTFHHLISAATTNATSVKASVGAANSITLSNNGAAVAYVKFYDKASAPTVGTDTPIMTVLVPINGTVSVDCGYAGIRFPTGIAYAITGGMPVADTTAVGAAQVSVAINYT